MTTAALPEPTAMVLRALPAYEQPRGSRPRHLHPAAPAPESTKPAQPTEPAAPPALPEPAPFPQWTRPPAPQPRLARLVTTLLEVLDGSRPIEQVRALVSPRVFSALPIRTRAAVARGARLRLHAVHSCRPVATAIEVTAVITETRRDRPVRYRCVALRLELLERTGWTCTVLRVL